MVQQYFTLAILVKQKKNKYYKKFVGLNVGIIIFKPLLRVGNNYFQPYNQKPKNFPPAAEFYVYIFINLIFPRGAGRWTRKGTELELVGAAVPDAPDAFLIIS